MEYDTVHLVNDFITEEKLTRFKEDKASGKPNLEKLNEEINLLYVAVTRTRNSIHIPEDLVPAGFQPSSQIHVMKVAEEELPENPLQEITGAAFKTMWKENTIDKAYSLDEVRTKYKDAYRPWTAELDHELTVMYHEGINIKDLAKHFGRTRGAITSRIGKLEL
jgi:F-box protein, helicase, 18